MVDPRQVKGTELFRGINKTTKSGLARLNSIIHEH